MKKIKTFTQLTFLLSLVFQFISCSKNNIEEQPLNTTNQTTTTTTNKSNFITFKYNNKTYTYNPETITSANKLIQGYDTDRRIQLWMPKSPTVGSHTIVDSPSDTYSYGAVYTENSSSIYLNGTAGTLKITSITDTSIEGTFNFSGVINGVTYQVTDGSFKADK